MNNRAVIAAVAIAALAIACVVGGGFAYTAITSSDSNEFNPDRSISATDQYGHKNIQIPDITYYQMGSLWYPDSVAHSLDLILDLKNTESTAYIRMFAEFENPMSWTVIKQCSFMVDGTRYACYDSNLDPPSTSSPYVTDAIPVDPTADHTYRIEVVYKEQITYDPAAFTGDNMKSKVVFIQSDEDPMV